MELHISRWNGKNIMNLSAFMMPNKILMFISIWFLKLGTICMPFFFCSFSFIHRLLFNWKAIIYKFWHFNNGQLHSHSMRPSILANTIKYLKWPIVGWAVNYITSGSLDCITILHLVRGMLWSTFSIYLSLIWEDKLIRYPFMIYGSFPSGRKVELTYKECIIWNKEKL